MVCPEGSSYLLRGRIFLYHWQGVQRANGKPPALSVGMFPHGFSRRVRPEGDWGRAESPQCARRRKPPAPVGIDAPTPAREQGWQPYGALTLFFRWRKKSVQKKASGTATPEAARPAARRGLRPAVALRAVLVLGSLRSPAGKKPFIAHFDGGARYVARSGVGQLTHAIVRARSSPFSAVKMGGPFSLRCLSPLCFGAVGGGHTYPLQVGMLRCGWKILRRG